MVREEMMVGSSDFFPEKMENSSVSVSPVSVAITEKRVLFESE